MNNISLSSLKSFFGRTQRVKPSFDSRHGFPPLPGQPVDKPLRSTTSNTDLNLNTTLNIEDIVVSKIPTFEESMAKFNMGREDREDIIASDPIWASEQLLSHLDFKTLKVVLEHIAKRAKIYGGGYEIEESMDWESFGYYIEQGRTGLVWSLPEKFASFQAQALAHTNVNEKKELMPLVLNVLMATRTYQMHVDKWLLNAETFLSHGGQLPWPALASALYLKDSQHSLNPISLDQVPLVIDFFNTQADEAQFVAWYISNIETPYSSSCPLKWLCETHPNVDVWRLGDDPTCSSVMLTSMAEHLKDGSLFKAWHGIELSPDEVITFPIAQSLYVHKHAPVYRDSIMPLPNHWEVALALAQTGSQFKAMVIQSYNAKQQNIEPVAFALPEMTP